MTMNIIETYELPTESGTYRYKKHPEDKWDVVEIKDGGENWGLYINDFHSSSLESMRGWIWGGKIASAEDILAEVNAKKEEIFKQLDSYSESKGTGIITIDEVKAIIERLI